MLTYAISTKSSLRFHLEGLSTLTRSPTRRRRSLGIPSASKSSVEASNSLARVDYMVPKIGNWAALAGWVVSVISHSADRVAMMVVPSVGDQFTVVFPETATQGQTSGPQAEDRIHTFHSDPQWNAHHKQFHPDENDVARHAFPYGAVVESSGPRS